MAGFDDIKQKSGDLLSQRGTDLLKQRADRVAQRTQKEVKTLDTMARNLKEIDQITNDMSKAFEDRLERITQLNTSVEELKRQQSQAARGFGGGGGGREWPGLGGTFSSAGGGGRFGGAMQSMGQMMGPTGQFAQAGASMAGSYANYQQYANVTSQMLDMQNRIAFGNINNQRFQDVRSATSGDMGALRRIMADSFADAIKDSMRLGQAQQDVLQTRMAGAVAETVGQGLQTGASLIGPGRAAKAAQGMGRAGRIAQRGADAASFGANVASPMAQAGILNTNIEQQISQGQITAQRYQQLRQAQDVMSQIDDAVMQRAYDTLTGTTLATRGLGVGRVDQSMYDQVIPMQGTGVPGSGARSSADNRMSQPSGRSNAAQVLGLSSLRQAPLNDVEKEALRQVEIGRKLAPDADFEMQQLRRQQYEEQTNAIAEHVFGMTLTAPAPEKTPPKRPKLKEGERMSYSKWLGGADESPSTTAIKEGQAGAGALSSANPLTGGVPGSPVNPITGVGMGSYMDKWEGTRYVWGGASLNGIDCSGFAQKVMMAGGALPSGADRFMDRTAASLRNDMDRGEGERIDNVKDAREGDLIFFRNKYGNKKGRVTHVGVSRGGGMMTDASMGRGGVATREVSELQGKYDMEVYRPEYGTRYNQSQKDYIAENRALPPPTRDSSFAPGFEGAFRRGGGDRQDVMDLLRDPSFIGMLAGRGLSQDQLPKVVAAGVSGLGKEFAQDAAQTLTRAAETAQVGYMQSPEQYMQARSMLTGVGGGGDDLERIMRTAVAAGMDSSKNIMEMVSATQTLSARSAQMGVQSVVGATEMLGRGIQALDFLPENMRSGAALAAGQAVEQLSTDKSLSMGNMMEMARLRKDFPEASQLELEAMSRLSMTQVNQMVSSFRKSPEEGRQAAAQFGLEGLVGNMGQAQQLGAAVRLGTETGFTGVGIDRELDKLQQRVRDEGVNSLSPAERNRHRTLLRQMSVMRGYSGESFMAQTDFTQQAGQGVLQQAPGGIVGSGEQALAAQGQMDARLFNEGVKQFTTAMGGLEGLGATLESFATSVDVNKFAETTQQSMKDMSMATGQFSTTMKDLNTNLKDLTSELGTLISRMKGSKAGTGLMRQQGNPIGSDD